jgi:DNA sulfur modification protein DndC
VQTGIIRARNTSFRCIAFIGLVRCHRETVEGFPVTERFRQAIYALLGVTGGFRGMLCHPVFDPYGTGVDQFTEEDAVVIQRIMAEKQERDVAIV